MVIKRCSTCGETKALDLYHRNKNSKDGKSCRCKECAIDAANKYFENNADKVVQNKKARRKDIRYSLREAAKDRATRANLPFNIEIEDIVVPEFCPVLNIKLEKSKTGIATACSPSLDKIIPHKGYVKGNIIVMSYKANLMKNNATVKELLLFSDWVKLNFKGNE